MDNRFPHTDVSRVDQPLRHRMQANWACCNKVRYPISSPLSLALKLFLCRNTAFGHGMRELNPERVMEGEEEAIRFLMVTRTLNAYGGRCWTEAEEIEKFFAKEDGINNNKSVSTITIFLFSTFPRIIFFFSLGVGSCGDYNYEMRKLIMR